MKRKFETIKTLQLLATIALAAVGLIVIFRDDRLYQMVGRDPSVRALCILLWLALGIAFVGIFWDFTTHSSFKKDYRELDYAVCNDPVAGIANRYSCDAMIEKYLDAPLPDHLGCAMLDLLNLREINETHGRAKGNESIQEFANILYSASLGLCFVGRNGGNQFMALFETCSEGKINTFLSRVHRQVDFYNARADIPSIEYRSGRAIARDEAVDSITQLIALANRRLTLQTDRVAGIASRTSCDEIIGAYMDKPLPRNIGCVMLDIANIREINEAGGHAEGNRVIRQFGDILREAAAGLCFVGRNGGTKFLALFEDCDEDKIEAFLEGVHGRMRAINSGGRHAPIQYRWGRAFHEDREIGGIHRLVALADRRLYDPKA